MEPRKLLGWAQTVRVYLTTAAREEGAFFDIPSPVRSTFEANPFTFTLPANSPFVGKKIAVVIFVSAEARSSANFAFTPVFSEVTGAVEEFFTLRDEDDPYITVSGWVNFSGASGHVEIDMLNEGNGKSACDSNDGSCRSDNLWTTTMSVTSYLEPRKPIPDADRQYDWISPTFKPSCGNKSFSGCLPLGGTARIRVRAILNLGQGVGEQTGRILPSVEQGYQHPFQSGSGRRQAHP
jgi:hypothetical protein